ncbi:MAG: hypothetical protein KAS32_23740 [Candidatus Peribacteraceae bacterium]|nr:hypothetical protein [Candidatus Peribacteraceae bacterium]
MSFIQLEVPEGKYCKECMFLDVDYMRNSAHCRLFSNTPPSKLSYSSIDIDSIVKLSACPEDSA